MSELSSSNTVNANQTHSVTRRSSFVDSYITGVLAVDGIASGHVISLCAEPGMGRTTILTHICQSIDSTCGMAKYYDLSLTEGVNAATHIVKSCRQMTHYLSPDQVCVIAFDNVPPMDETDIFRAVRAIRKYVLLNGNVLLSMVPEAEGLIEALPEATCYRAAELLVDFGNQRVPAYSPGSGSGNAISVMTHGIPALVKVAMLAPEEFSHNGCRDPRYISSLCDVVEHTLRPSLIREERELRLAMIELGSGNVSELRSALRGIDSSTIQSLSSNAPFFSLDAVTGQFSCAGVSSDACLVPVMHRIRASITRMSHVSSAVADLLAKRQDFARAGIVILACTPRDRANLLLRYPSEFVDAGCGNMLQEAVSFAAETGETEGVSEARLALACATSSAREYESLLANLVEPDCALTLRSLIRLREGLSGHGSRQLAQKDESAMARGSSACQAILVAMKGLCLMGDFRFADAYTYLLGSPERMAGNSLVAGVLWGEYLLSMGLSGGTPAMEDLSGFDECTRFAEQAGLSLLSQVLAAVPSLVSVLAGRNESAFGVESCAQHAAIMGMDRIRAICLLAMAVSDQRTGARARSFVRLGQVAELAAKSKDTHLVAACRILQCATKRALGERVTADEVLAIHVPARLSMVGRMLAAVIERADGARLDVIGKLRTSRCPKGTSWLVNILANDFGELSSRFRDVAPSPWVAEAERCATVAGEFQERPVPVVEGPDPEESIQGGYHLDISLLGGLSITVNGAPVEASRIERRRGKSLLALLAALPGHQAKRFEAMESVWPEYDFHDARQRVYEATSVLRTELVTRLGLKGAEPFASNRGAGTLSLNPDCVHCDVDDFEELAKTVLANSRLRPSDVVSRCVVLEQMYRGDLFVPQVDGAGLIEARRDEIRRLYADVMVFASTQALSLGKAQIAVHYAKIACRLDAFREDAQLCLVRALTASGRRIDAESSFRQFADRLVHEKKRPPSRELREAYHQAVGGTEELVLHVGDGGSEDIQRRAASA